MFAMPAGNPVTTADLESLPGLERKAMDAFKALGSQVVPAVADDPHLKPASGIGAITWQAFHADPEALKQALRSRPDDELANIARVYLENSHDRPVEAVQDAFGLERRTADRRIRAARDRGFLPPTPQDVRKSRLESQPKIEGQA